MAHEILGELICLGIEASVEVGLESKKGCGCLVIILVVIILAFLCYYFS